MADMTIPQKALIDAKGNILIHGKAAVSLELEFQNDDETPKDVSARTISFVVKGKLDIELDQGSASNIKVLNLSAAQVKSIGLADGSEGPLFVLLDPAEANDALWEGMVLVRGFS